MSVHRTVVSTGHGLESELELAAREYLEATTGAFNSPRVQHTRKRLRAVLAKPKAQTISDVVFAPWQAPSAQADGEP